MTENHETQKPVPNWKEIKCRSCKWCRPIEGFTDGYGHNYHGCCNIKSPFYQFFVAVVGEACAKWEENPACPGCDDCVDGRCALETGHCLHPYGFISKDDVLVGGWSSGEDKKTVVFDFDGVIHSYTSGWKENSIIPDPPVPGIRKVIDNLNKDYKVVVVSTRCRDYSGREAIKDWLKHNRIAVYDVTADKPPAVCYVDDRAIRFDGTTDCLEEKIRYFKSWVDEARESGDEHGPCQNSNAAGSGGNP